MLQSVLNTYETVVFSAKIVFPTQTTDSKRILKSIPEATTADIGAHFIL